jgi:hypothetical protein
MRNVRSKTLVLGASLLAGLAGCGEKSGVHEETQVTTPDGTKTITRDTEVKTTGENPPAVPDKP